MNAVLDKVLVVGGSGQVGHALLDLLPAHSALGTYVQAPFEGGFQLDLAELARQPALAGTLLDERRPSAVICAAGWNDVEGCEGQLARAMAINCEAPARLAAACAQRGTPFVYYSSEYVFDGARGPYVEGDTPAPISDYGRSKAEAERAIIERHARALILRTTVVYGRDRHAKNFAYRLAGTLAAGKPIRVPNDQVSTPTYNRDLAQMTLALLQKRARGIYHACGFERMSRADFARRVAVAAGLDPALIEGVDTRTLGQRAPRPLDAGLDCTTIAHELPTPHPLNVEAAIAHWLASSGPWWLSREEHAL
ncbi:MAG TPA: SDR family oxidoreductase [Polyangiales bacterium]|nr:SDR family oxidoreductase [Polyangiales bacterium]